MVAMICDDCVSMIERANERADGAYTIPEPIGRGGKSHTTRPDRKWEYLADNHPRTRSPGGSKEGDVEANECNHC